MWLGKSPSECQLLALRIRSYIDRDMGDSRGHGAAGTSVYPSLCVSFMQALSASANITSTGRTTRYGATRNQPPGYYRAAERRPQFSGASFVGRPRNAQLPPIRERHQLVGRSWKNLVLPGRSCPQNRQRNISFILSVLPAPTAFPGTSILTISIENTCCRHGVFLSS